MGSGLSISASLADIPLLPSEDLGHPAQVKPSGGVRTSEGDEPSSVRVGFEFRQELCLKF